MSDSFDFRTASHFTVGAIGEPGRRVFFLQAGDQHEHVSLKLEKQQAIALATFLRTVLDDMPVPDNDPRPMALVNPVEPRMGRRSDRRRHGRPDEILILVEELVIPDEDDDDDEETTASRFGPTAPPARRTSHRAGGQLHRTVDELSARVDRRVASAAARSIPRGTSAPG